METKLKSYTIVPDNLYVERKADQQLHGIIEAMQRPGYVLVSRQMGKTNLLLRAKRKWENARDIYVYIDMSNIDETEKECFQTLIDTAIDTHENVLGSLRERIQDLRRTNITKSAVQSHNEELRVLLSAVEGKLVFILDEIDSLTRTSFSDNIFSQIRSVYFSRINYPVLEKLTYVLSGVVEPTEIIKNPKISPFNIGEKILLDDFSQDEYQSFIRQAGLVHFGGEVLDRIFYWTGGNPRMTWDVCYELQCIDNITQGMVDTLVKKLYLTTFDKAPVDTIRSIVKEDRILRDAIIQLAYDKGNILSDKIKSKLYLSGIVNYYDNDIKIKNRIIKESLSLSWLQKIEEEEKGLLTYAIELHSKGHYQESVNKFEDYLKNNNFQEENAPFYYYYMGSCYYHLRDFERSLHYLTIKPIDPMESAVNYRSENFLAGADCLKIGRYQDALVYFENVMSVDSRDWHYYSAKLNSLSAKALLVKGETEQLEQVKNEYKNLLLLQDEQGIDKVKLYAAYQLASLYSAEQKEESSRLYDLALSYASETDKPRILSGKFYVASDKEKLLVLEALKDSIKNIDTLTETLEPDNALGFDEDVLIQSLYIIYAYAPDSWGDIKAKLQLLPYTYGDALYMVFQQGLIRTSESFGKGTSRLADELYNNINSIEYELSAEKKEAVYKFNAFLNYSERNAQEYLSYLKTTSGKVDPFGLLVIRNYTWALLERKAYRTIVNEVWWVPDRFAENLTEQEIVPKALLEYCLLMSYYLLSEGPRSLEMAELILSHIKDDIKQANDRNRDTLGQIKDAALRVQSVLMPREPIRSQVTHGRNERVKVCYVQSGREKYEKYKHVKDDIIKGVCIIVEDE